MGQARDCRQQRPSWFALWICFGCWAGGLEYAVEKGEMWAGMAGLQAIEGDREQERKRDERLAPALLLLLLLLGRERKTRFKALLARKLDG